MPPILTATHPTRCDGALAYLVLLTLGLSGSAGDGRAAVAPATATVSLILQAGPAERSEGRITVEASRALTVVLEGTAKCLAYDLKGGDGRSLLPATRRRQWVGEVEWIESFWIRDWTGGEIVASLRADVAAPAELTVTVLYDDGFRVVPLVAREVWTVGASFNLNACIQRTGEVVVGESMELTATIAPPSGDPTEVVLYDDGRHGDGTAGDGVFGRSVMTVDAGRHTLRLRGKYRVDGKVVDRETEAVYYAIDRKTAARFAGEPVVRAQDHNKNGRHDALSIEFPVNYPRGSRIAIHARLEDATGKVIHPDVTMQGMNMAPKRDHVISISVDGDRIVRRGTDGRFFLRDIRMWDKKADMLADVLEDATTESYTIGSFEPPKAPTSNE